MKIIQPPVNINSTTEVIANLQDALALLGFSVDGDERSTRVYGDLTRRAVIRFQSRWQLSGTEGFIDEATAQKMNELLHRQGAFDETTIFKVSGRVVNTLLEPISKQSVLVYDVDLRGARIYKDVNDIRKIEENGGFELLGRAETTREGYYELGFKKDQFRKSEKEFADVIAYATNETTIIGRSRLSTSADYSNNGDLENWNVFLSGEETRRGASEYTLVMETIEPLLRESDLRLFELNGSFEQSAFLATESGQDPQKINLLVQADLLRQNRANDSLGLDLLYGIGRQHIALEWPSLAVIGGQQLTTAINTSVARNIINDPGGENIKVFIQTLLTAASEALLNVQAPDIVNVKRLLGFSLPDQVMQRDFVRIYSDFEGTPEQFWKEHLPSQPGFQNRLELIKSLQFTNQLMLLTGNHSPLIEELQVKRNLEAPTALLELSRDNWTAILNETGYPEDVTEERRGDYIDQIENTLNAAFPTQKISLMVKKGELLHPDANVNDATKTFFERAENFDLSLSRISDFDNVIQSVANGNNGQLKEHLLTMQRVFQVSPSPKTMIQLIENKLDSSLKIASIPYQSFLKKYESILGRDVADSVHKRAVYQTNKIQFTAVSLHEITHAAKPAFSIYTPDVTELTSTIKKHIPNYEELFGRADICECEHCRSVYSAAAYYVDMLRFLQMSAPNASGKSPLESLLLRRPDLAHILLTCENTNTIIPYIDLVNEVLEYYVTWNKLDKNAVHNTLNVTAAELRANPQFTMIEAYKKLKDAVYPFRLPYHQPLDTIRLYLNHLETSRYEIMLAFQDSSLPAVKLAIESEFLQLSEEEFAILTGTLFDGTSALRNIWEYFGYASQADFDAAVFNIPELLTRTGVNYKDLVELIKTRLINPYQKTLEYLQDLFDESAITASDLYKKLEQIKAGTLVPSGDIDLMMVLAGQGISSDEFTTWVNEHFEKLGSVITIYEPKSKCSLEFASLRSVKNIYENIPGAGIADTSMVRLHTFIRLWRKTGFQIHEVDSIIAGLDHSTINSDLILNLACLTKINAVLKLTWSQLITFWGPIDTYAKTSLYTKLFLNKSLQKIDPVYKPDKYGNYLPDKTKLLKDHIPGVLAAFKIGADDLDAILIKEGFDINTLVLSLENLSIVYRYTLFAKGMRIKISELLMLLDIFSIKPFSQWDASQQKFVSIDPDLTLKFIEKIEAVRSAGFKPNVLHYIINGTPVPDTLALDEQKIDQSILFIRKAFRQIDAENPDSEISLITEELLKKKLSLLFSGTITDQFLAMLNGTELYRTYTEKNLTIVIPDDLKAKITYVKGSGLLQCKAVLQDSEKTQLENLAGSTGAWKAALQNIYEKPEQFLLENFGGVLPNLPLAINQLINHPSQPTPFTTFEKWRTFYTAYLPYLKKELRKSSTAQQIASLCELEPSSVIMLLKVEWDGLLSLLGQNGLSGEYFKDMTLTVSGLKRIDAMLDFVWSLQPDNLIPADGFSVRWEGHLSSSVGGTYTFFISTEEADESFRLWIDGQLVVEKPAGNNQLSWETVLDLSADKTYQIKLEFAEASQKSGIHLSWKTESTPKEIVQPIFLCPQIVVGLFVDKVTAVRKAALLINGFKLSDEEIAHFITWKTNFSNLDFFALTAAHWELLGQYSKLKVAFSSLPGSLLQVFEEANKTSPAASMDDLLLMVANATGWKRSYVDDLFKNIFGFTGADLRDARVLARMHEIMELSYKTGANVSLLHDWSAVSLTYEQLNDIAQAIKNCVKAKYEDPDWLTVAKEINNVLRTHQKQALIDFLLVEKKLVDWGVRDADSLFEYFLIDVQMEACMDTSRIKQAISSVQLFINRCLLNLENSRNDVAEEVSPDLIDAERFGWSKVYRVWELFRKCVLYPENWLEPEWRDNKSFSFKEMESELLQNDITAQSVETACRNYIDKLNIVSNLDVCGMYQDVETDTLHIVGRSHSIPYQYFYRTRDRFKKWDAWQKMPVDIKSVEQNEENREYSGVHVVPVVWKKRLFVFWPEFMRKTEESSTADTPTETSKKPFGELEPRHYWEVHLAWSEHREGKWGGKQVSKEVIVPGNTLKTKDLITYLIFEKAGFEDIVKNYRLNPVVTHGNQLELTLMLDNTEDHGTFCLSDVQSKIEIRYALGHFSAPFQITSVGSAITTPGLAGIESYFGSVLEKPARYKTWYMGFSLDDKLHFKGNDYLNLSQPHKILYSNNVRAGSFENRLEYPFFYSDKYRSYFAEPVDISYVLNTFKEPEKSWHLPLDGIKKKYLAPRIPEPKPPVDFKQSVLGEMAENSFNIQPVLNTLFASAVNAVPYISTANALSGRFSDISVAAKQPLANMKSEKKIAGAFKGTYKEAADPIINIGKFAVEKNKGLLVRSFFHPYSDFFLTRLNQGGIPGLLTLPSTFDTTTNQYVHTDNGNKLEDAGKLFDQVYKPNKKNGIIQNPLPKVNIDFDEFGTYSIYNWELFFHMPVFIATRLSKNGKFREAIQWFHYVFNPTVAEKPDPKNPNGHYWRLPPFKTVPNESIEDFFRGLKPNMDPKKVNPKISEWLANPFKPHVVASVRPIAYMKNVVFKYVETLIAWGDNLFQRDTIESINEATQLYIIASHILGKRPESVPQRGTVKPETYDSLRSKLDDFSNAMVKLENVFPFSSDISEPDSSSTTNLLGIGNTLYFCIPDNEKMLEYWDTVADRLFKIRHCMNIEGVERKLALFEPPIDPAMFLGALAKGMSIDSLIAALNSPAPFYRFMYLSQKATEFCHEVKFLGNALLAAIEKKDAESLALLRQQHEAKILELTEGIKSRQVLEAKASKQSLEKSREASIKKIRYYSELLGKPEGEIPIPGIPQIGLDINEQTELPGDTVIANVSPDVDVKLVDSDEKGVKLISKEKDELDSMSEALHAQNRVSVMEMIASVFHALPTGSIDTKPLGVGIGMLWGPEFLGRAASAMGKAFQIDASNKTFDANKAAKLAGYIRREQEWCFQANIAAKEVVQLDKQITAADIRLQISNRELGILRKQREQSTQVEQFLKEKFSNTELHQWMRERLFLVYKQSYNLAYELAKRAEKAYQFELGISNSNFIQYGYWDNTQQGLTSGEQLHLAIRQMDSAYIENNRREFELVKHISVAMLAPSALLELKQTGSCELELPEELFDLDYPGHYFRRIKSVGITIPCIVGPFTTVNCTLRLLQNSIRINTLNGDNGYVHNNDEGVPTDDSRFVENSVPFKSIATSSAQNDNGLFELNFRDERYLPFEGGGVISKWKIELNCKYLVANKLIDISQFDCNTISDVVVHCRYTSREDAGKFRQDVLQHLDDYMKNIIDNSTEPFIRFVSLKNEFPDAFYQLLNKSLTDQKTELDINKNHFNHLFTARTINVVHTHVLLMPLGGKSITVPAVLKVDGQVAGSWIKILKGEIRQAILPLGEFNPVKKWKIDAGNLGLKREEISDIIIVMSYRVN